MDMDINGFVADLYQTLLEPGEIVTELIRHVIPKLGCTVFKRAPAFTRFPLAN
jgi:hypothetical protein